MIPPLLTTLILVGSIILDEGHVDAGADAVSRRQCVDR